MSLRGRVTSSGYEPGRLQFPDHPSHRIDPMNHIRSYILHGMPGEILPHISTSLTVAEAAKRLGVHPQRIYPLIRVGALRAFKHGGRWEIDPAAVDRLRHQQRPPGRPFTPENAWALIALAAPGELCAPTLSAKSTSRLRGELRGVHGRLDRLAPRLRSRSVVRRLRAHPGDLDRVAQHLVLGGAQAGARSAPARERIFDEGVVEGYLREGDAAGLARGFQLSEERGDNVVLHLVPSRIWPFPRHARVAPSAVAALDLFDSGDQRAGRVGRELLRHLATEFDS